jgi:hypothetical protein
MTRIQTLLLLAATLLSGAPAGALTRVERGNLIFENIPEPAAGMAEKLDAYLNSRQATPLGFSPKGQLLIATRFDDVDQLHLGTARAIGGSSPFCTNRSRKLRFHPIPSASALCTLDVGQ